MFVKAVVKLCCRYGFWVGQSSDTRQCIGVSVVAAVTLSGLSSGPWTACTGVGGPVLGPKMACALAPMVAVVAAAPSSSVLGPPGSVWPLC